MQSPCIDACNTFNTPHHRLLGFRPSLHSLSSPPPTLSIRSSSPRVFCRSGARRNGGERVEARAKGKDNVWSVDNEMAEMEKKREKQKRRTRGRVRGRGRGRGRNARGDGDRVMVSGSMLMEIETVLQIQEPVIRPAWNTFASSVSGIWKGVGAVFSPITAEMDPIEIGNKNENLYDCYTLSRIEAISPPSRGEKSQIHRTINWVTLNPYGEVERLKQKSNHSYDSLPKYESFDFGKSDVMEEDTMTMEPGLVFFEDGAYSRGPVDIPVGEANESNYYLNPTFKFEQCLVKGCHKRLRIAHTIEFSNGGTDIQIMRIAVYEEKWASPANITEKSYLELDLKPFSQRKRISPSELTGSWKVFEVSATPIYGEEEDTIPDDTTSPPCVYFCMETLKKRNLPTNPSYFREEEIHDWQDATVLWLPGGVTAYVDVDKDGVLCIGVGWYSDEGINLVMERDYGMDGKLKEVRSKTEVKRRWSDSPPE